MKAVVFHQFGIKPEVETVNDPVTPVDGVVLRVLASGICRSDWHGWMGHDDEVTLPHVPGHELVGEVVDAGQEVKNFLVGDRVTVPFVSGCGSCDTCLAGNQQICDNQYQPGFSGWGSFAEYVSLPYADINLFKCPDYLPNASVAALGCRFITSYRAIVDVGNFGGGDWLAVHGCGGVGLSALMIGKAIGLRTIAVDINKDALRMASEVGCEVCINPGDEDVASLIKELTKGGAHGSIDALGSKETCVNSISSLRKSGTHIQVGLLAGDDYSPSLPMHLVIANELKIKGSHGMQAHRYPSVFNLIRDGKLDPGALITNRLSLEESIPFLIEMDKSRHYGITVIESFDQ